jgi:hypothetical protein
VNDRASRDHRHGATFVWEVFPWIPISPPYRGIPPLCGYTLIVGYITSIWGHSLSIGVCPQFVWVSPPHGSIPPIWGYTIWGAPPPYGGTAHMGDIPTIWGTPKYGKSSHIWDVFPHMGRLPMYGKSSHVWKVYPCMRSLPKDSKDSHGPAGFPWSHGNPMSSWGSLVYFPWAHKTPSCPRDSPFSRVLGYMWPVYPSTRAFGDASPCVQVLGYPGMHPHLPKVLGYMGMHRIYPVHGCEGCTPKSDFGTPGARGSHVKAPK